MSLSSLLAFCLYVYILACHTCSLCLSVKTNVHGRIRAVRWWPNFSVGQPAEWHKGRGAHILGSVLTTSEGLFLWQPSSGLWKWVMRGGEHSVWTGGPWRSCQYCSAPSPPRKRGGRLWQNKTNPARGAQRESERDTCHNVLCKEVAHVFWHSPKACLKSTWNQNCVLDIFFGHYVTSPCFFSCVFSVLVLSQK